MFVLRRFCFAVLTTVLFAAPAAYAAATHDQARKSADCFAFYLVMKNADPSAAGQEDSAKGMKFTGQMLNAQTAELKLDDAAKKMLVHDAVTHTETDVKAALAKHDANALKTRDEACRKLVMDHNK